MNFFYTQLQKHAGKKRFISVGLDPVLEKIPKAISAKYSSVEEQIFYFNTTLIDATADLVAVYKPNSAFYEAYGSQGMVALKKTIAYIHANYKNIPVLLDAKRADIGSTSQAYSKACFDDLKADAVTINPYLGQEAVRPFLQRSDKGIIVLVKTSNDGAGEFQDAIVEDKQLGRAPLYIKVARNVAESWNKGRNCAIVVGATYPSELASVRNTIGDMTILIPGIGTQGGDLEKSVKNGRNKLGQGFIISSSSGIIYASKKDDFADAARSETEKLNKEIGLAL